MTDAMITEGPPTKARNHRGVLMDYFVVDVWQDGDGQRFRRIVAAMGGKIAYSVGARMNRWCKVQTFHVWVRNRRARLTRRSGETKVEWPKTKKSKRPSP